MLKKSLCVILSVCLLLSLCACGNDEHQFTSTTKKTPAPTAEVTAEPTTEPTTEPTAEPATDIDDSKLNVAIQTEYGVIKIKLRPDVAPITVANFQKLVSEGFYDGLTFHRIIDGFMIQGGDPLGNGTGGSSEKIKGEFASNGIENNLSHTRGVVSMARSQMPDSASSQFFIMHADADYLDGNYAAFGEVTEGIEVVDEIVKNAVVQDANGTVLPDDQPIISKVYFIE